MKDYIEQATQTESLNPTFAHPRLLHAAMGLSTEVAELLLAEDDDDINVREELGDILWYTAVVGSVFEVSYPELRSLANPWVVQQDPLKSLIRGASEVLDHMKKVCFYGIAEVDGVLLGQQVANIILAVSILAEDEGWTLEEVQEINIAKLRRRYGKKFTTEAAINRNLEAEHDVLSSA